MTVSDAETSGGGGAQGGVIAEQNRKISPSAPNGASPFSDTPHVHSPCIEASRVNSTLGDVNLSLDEQASLRLFLSHVNSWRGARGYPSLSETAATKFLMARKFSVDRALALYQQHELMRIREKLSAIDISDEGPLKGVFL